METKWLEEIRKLVIISLFTDDDLMNVFVLKGGNAISLVHGINYRSSQDIDVSMAEDFSEEELDTVKEKLERALINNFKEQDYNIFDVNLTPQPLVKDEARAFWGGYRLEFKLIEADKYKKLKSDKDALRRNALSLNSEHAKKFKVDISKYEYCEGKDFKELEGYRIYVYTPLMVIYEKLRAICQQMEEYSEIARSSKSPRARDFFDIYIIMENLKPPLNPFSTEGIELLKNIFNVKKVSLDLLAKIKDEREFHDKDFYRVEGTVQNNYRLAGFDFYFDYVVKLSEKLKNVLEQTASSDQ